MFYERYLELCKARGVRPTNACVEAGLSRGLAAKWKSTKTEKPSTDALEKLSAYFGLTIEEVLGKANTPTVSGERMTDEDLKFALWGGADDITEEDLEDVRRYAAFVRARKKENK